MYSSSARIPPPHMQWKILQNVWPEYTNTTSIYLFRVQRTFIESRWTIQKRTQEWMSSAHFWARLLSCANAFSFAGFVHSLVLCWIIIFLNFYFCLCPSFGFQLFLYPCFPSPYISSVRAMLEYYFFYRPF